MLKSEEWLMCNTTKFHPSILRKVFHENSDAGIELQY